jgi:hypothetical protein
MSNWSDLAEVVTSRLSAIGLEINDDPEDYQDVEAALEKTVFLKKENAPTVVLERVTSDQESAIEAWLYIGGLECPLPFDSVDAIDGTQEDFDSLYEKTYDWAFEKGYAFIDKSDFGEKMATIKKTSKQNFGKDVMEITRYIEVQDSKPCNIVGRDGSKVSFMSIKAAKRALATLIASLPKRKSGEPKRFEIKK